MFLEAAWGPRARLIRRSGFKFCIRYALNKGITVWLQYVVHVTTEVQ